VVVFGYEMKNETIIEGSIRLPEVYRSDRVVEFIDDALLMRESERCDHQNKMGAKRARAERGILKSRF
jgi:hypothetical protein